MATESQLTFDRWEVAREVLEGRHECGHISPRAAAREAGVSLAEFRRWIARSREKREEDEAWIHEIAQVYDTRFQVQGEEVEDTMYHRAMKGVEVEEITVAENSISTKTKTVFDNKLLMRALEVRDPRYVQQRGTTINQNLILPDGGATIRERLLAQHRLAVAEEERVRRETVDAEFTELPAPGQGEQ